jgi:hypothetical protein
MPWTLLDSAESAERFAMRLEASRPARFKKGTSLSSALLRSHDLLRQSGYTGARRIINISGDGVDNDDERLARIRSMVLADGITVNGLPIIYKGLLEGVVADTEKVEADPMRLMRYFERKIIGGPFAFVEPVVTHHDYADAIRRKLIREVLLPTYAALPTPDQIFIPRSCLPTHARRSRRCVPP